MTGDMNTDQPCDGRDDPADLTFSLLTGYRANPASDITSCSDKSIAESVFKPGKTWRYVQRHQYNDSECCEMPALLLLVGKLSLEGCAVETVGCHLPGTCFSPLGVLLPTLPDPLAVFIVYFFVYFCSALHCTALHCTVDLVSGWPNADVRTVNVNNTSPPSTPKLSSRVRQSRRYTRGKLLGYNRRVCAQPFWRRRAARLESRNLGRHQASGDVILVVRASPCEHPSPYEPCIHFALLFGISSR